MAECGVKSEEVSIIELTQKNHTKLLEITDCVRKFKENKIRVIKLLTKCKKLTEKDSSEKNSLIVEELKDKLLRDGFKEAEDDIRKYFQVFQRVCSENDNCLIKEKCNNDFQLEESVKNALSFTTGNQLLFAKPCLAVFGQIKAGKSSLVNCILEEKVVIQREMRCTARVTYLSYCRENFVAHTLGNRLRELRIGDTVKENEVELSTEERRDLDKVKIEIRIGSTNRILQSGIDIIDSPGLNENTVLNDTCATIAKVYLPILIYVIDGRKGVTQEDISDIQAIQNENPHLKVIYFVTKLDRSQRDRRRKPGDELQVAKERLDYAYDRLVKCKFLPKGVAREECKDFHGASLWMVQDWQEKHRRPVVDVDQSASAQSESVTRAEEFCMRQFINFQESLLDFVKENLDYKMIRSVEKIKICIEQLVEKINNSLIKSHDNRRAIEDSILMFEDIEERLFSSEHEHMESELKQEITNLLKKNKEGFLKVLSSSEYEFLAAKGLTQTSINDHQYQRPEIYKQCIDEIKQLLETELNRRIKKFVIDFMKKKQTNLKEELTKIVSRLSERTFGLTSFETMLQNRLLHEYEFYVKFSGGDGHKNSINTFLKNALRPVKSIFKQLKGPLPEHKLPTSITWKEKHGRILLENLNKEDFTSQISEAIIEGFEEKHSRFVNQLKVQKQVLEIKVKEENIERATLKELVKKLQVQYMNCFEVSSDYSFQKFEFDCPTSQHIAKSGDGEVRQFGGFVAKKIQIETLAQKSMCAVEVYFASRLCHSKVLRLEGVQLKKIAKYKRECILYYPYMAGRDLKYFIETRKPPQLDRIQFAIDIAEGLMILHKEDITHGDIKLENILMKPVDNGYEAVVSDYGYVKQIARLNKSNLGSNIYTASERQNYNARVDIFSYGIMLWFLISYMTDYYYETDSKIWWDPETIEARIKNGERPEKKTIDKEFFDLMLKCWDPDAKKCPTWEEIIDTLRSIKSNVQEDKPIFT